MEIEPITLHIADYIVTILMLLVPLGIGGFFAVRDWKRATRDEYLLGGRQMSMLPVTLSLFVTFQSAISLMGIPADVFNYGSIFGLVYIGFSLSYLVGLFTAVPVLYPLHLTSIYEYLELRFESKTLRLLSTLLGMLQTCCYMAVVQLAPALALQAAAGIPLWMSIVIVGLIGTIYTAMGGIKSVVWTDAFQCAIMFIGILTVVIKGSSVVGGIEESMLTAKENGRLSFSRLSPDLRERHTIWSTVIGGFFMWLPNTVNQANLQRISAMKTRRDASMSYILNIPLTVVYGMLLVIVGCVSYSYFHHLGCDPFEAGLIQSRNQLVPYFVLHALQDLPGMSGCFMATLFSGSLSTLSSGINALAANTVEDLFKSQLDRVSEKTATWITKLIVVVYGGIIVCLSYLANSLKGPVTQLGLSIFGAWGGPILGIFTAGAAVPWINKYGALIGGSASIIFNSYLAVGNQIMGKKNRMLPKISGTTCFGNFSWILVGNDNSTSLFSTNLPETTLGYEETSSSTSDPYAYGFFLYDISYEWYGVIGFILSFLLATIVSLLTRSLCRSQPNAKLIFPFLRKFWKLAEPHHSKADEYNKTAIVNLELSKQKVKNFQQNVLEQDVAVTEPSDEENANGTLLSKTRNTDM